MGSPLGGYAIEVIRPVGQRRGVAVVRTPGTCALHMYWATQEQHSFPMNDHHPELGPMVRGVAYLTEDQRRTLAAALLEGLSNG